MTDDSFSVQLFLIQRVTVVLRIGKIEIKQLKGEKCRIMTFYEFVS